MVEITSESIENPCPEGEHVFQALKAPHSFVEADLSQVYLSTPEIKLCSRCGSIELRDRKLLHEVVLACLVQKPAQLSAREAEYVRKWVDVPPPVFAVSLRFSLAEWASMVDRNEAIGLQADQTLRLRVIRTLSESGRMSSLERLVDISYQLAGQPGRAEDSDLRLEIEGGAGWANTQFHWMKGASRPPRKH